jgi:dTDP-4-dehydrorhamnose reductase
VADSLYRPGIEDADWKIVDITERDAVDKAIEEVRPDAVVNVAAVADIDKAEQEKDLAWKVNVEGAQVLAESCAGRGIKYVFFSSDAVFDGQGSLYAEEDKPNPVNYYGYTKAEAEKAVLEAHPQAVVIRISLVLGFPVTGGNSFWAGLESKLKAGQEILCPTDEIRTPVDVTTLSECVLELAENDFSGILHIGATDSINRYELIRKLAKKMGFDEGLVRPQGLPPARPDRAPRHKNGIISVSKAQRVLGTKLLSLDESIERAIAERQI